MPDARSSCLCALLVLCLTALAFTVWSCDYEETRYAIVFDAGSSGTRLNVYAFPRRTSKLVAPFPIYVAPNASKPWSAKMTPGISCFANDGVSRGPAEPCTGHKASDVKAGIKGLLDKALAYIPADHHASTTAILGATAGMRMIDAKAAEAVYAVINETMKSSGFDSQGAYTLPGSKEALFGWLSVNYVKGGLYNASIPVVGAADCGGASTQLTYSVETVHDDEKVEAPAAVSSSLLAGGHSSSSSSSSSSPSSLLGPTLAGDDSITNNPNVEELSVYSRRHKLFRHSWLYFGQDQAQVRARMAAFRSSQNVSSGAAVASAAAAAAKQPAAAFVDPCLPAGFATSWGSAGAEYSVSGSSNVTACEKLIDDLFSNVSSFATPVAQPPFSPFTSVAQPPFATPDQPFVLISAFAYQVAFFTKAKNNKDSVVSPVDGKEYGRLDTSRPAADALRAHAEVYCALDSSGRSSLYKDAAPYNSSRCFDLLYVARLMKAYRLDTLTGPPPVVEASEDYGWTLGAALYLNREIPINTDFYTETRMSWDEGLPLIVALGVIAVMSGGFLVVELCGYVKEMKLRNGSDDDGGIPYHAQVDPLVPRTGTGAIIPDPSFS